MIDRLNHEPEGVIVALIIKNGVPVFAEQTWAAWTTEDRAYIVKWVMTLNAYCQAQLPLSVIRYGEPTDGK